jgi:hypothetical protein
MLIVENATANVEIESLVPWKLYMRGCDTRADVIIAPQGKFKEYMPLSELTQQIRTRNPIFTGTDGRGSHALARILDDDVRRELLGAESDDAILLTTDVYRGLLKIRDREEFRKRLAELSVTESYRRLLVSLASLVEIDDAAGWMRDAVLDAGRGSFTFDIG